MLRVEAAAATELVELVEAAGVEESVGDKRQEQV
jgi:hypothetical protein